MNSNLPHTCYTATIPMAPPLKLLLVPCLPPGLLPSARSPDSCCSCSNITAVASCPSTTPSARVSCTQHIKNHNFLTAALSSRRLGAEQVAADLAHASSRRRSVSASTTAPGPQSNRAATSATTATDIPLRTGHRACAQLVVNVQHFTFKSVLQLI